MENFLKYIKEGGNAPLPSLEQMDELLTNYPWFTTASVIRRMVEVESGVEEKPSRLLNLHFKLAPVPFHRLPKVDADELSRPTERLIINSFLSKTEHKIVPPDNADDDDVVAPADAPIADLVSEQLAEIYMKQQLWGKAKETYEKLSLLYPKKSVYFAEIIERINANIES